MRKIAENRPCVRNSRPCVRPDKIRLIVKFIKPRIPEPGAGRAGSHAIMTSITIFDSLAKTPSTRNPR